ncbi:MAG: 1-acyl-sn-glycerol-3-phosphate acyltransferase [Sphingobacteriia bacterium]
MIFKVFKLLIRAALFIFCKKIAVINRSQFSIKGPLLVVANHPNSFLDAIIIGSIFRENVHFLARGDAFRQKKHRFLLKMLKMIPIYRLSEGKENLHLNEYAFTESGRILNNGGIVLIFIEGICVNSHELQPFKKGAARIALNSNTHNPLSVLPVSIAYDSFTRFGKNVRVEAAHPVLASTLFPFIEESKNLNWFNEQLYPILKSMIHVPVSHKSSHSLVQTIMAFIGKWLHYPFYFLLSNSIKEKTKGTVFYDSVLFGSLFLIYPMYFLIVHVIIWAISGSFLTLLLSAILHIAGAISASRWAK